MRVVYVCVDPGVPVFGAKGSSVHVQAVLRSLTRRGAQVHLVCTRPGGSPAEDLRGVEVHPVTVRKTEEPSDREAALREADASVAQVLDELGSQAKVDLVYERYSLWGTAATSWAQANGVTSVLEVNAPLIDEQERHRELVDRAGAECVARSAFGAASTVVCVSDQVSAWVRARRAAPERVHTVPNGVDVNRIAPAPVEPTGPFTIGFTGTLKPWHGVTTLIEALALLRADGDGWRVLLVGDGPEREQLATLAAGLGVADLVEMTGAVDPARIPQMLRRMHVAVAPYPPLADFYFSPLKVYEYLAAGLPIVASSVGPLPEVLAHGRCGVLVEPGDARALADALRTLRADPQRRQELGRAARESAVIDHDWDAVVDRILMLAGVLHGAV